MKVSRLFRGACVAAALSCLGVAADASARNRQRGKPRPSRRRDDLEGLRRAPRRRRLTAASTAGLAAASIATARSIAAELTAAAGLTAIAEAMAIVPAMAGGRVRAGMAGRPAAPSPQARRSASSARRPRCPTLALRRRRASAGTTPDPSRTPGFLGRLPVGGGADRERGRFHPSWSLALCGRSRRRPEHLPRGWPRRLGIFVDRARMHRDAREILDRLKVDVNSVYQKVQSLSEGGSNRHLLRAQGGDLRGADRQSLGDRNEPAAYRGMAGLPLGSPSSQRC